jgi:hypothetical protein
VLRTPLFVHDGEDNKKQNEKSRTFKAMDF